MNGEPRDEQTLDVEIPVVPGHLPGEAVPGSVAEPDVPAPPPYGLSDTSWSEDQWYQMLEELVSSKIANWKDICSLVLGSLNPSQFGTSMASAEGFKNRYGKGNTMRIVMEWAYAQNGKCATCGSRLDLQADHAQSKETFENPLDADFIENMVFRCRRCNVTRRPSHVFGGQTFLTAESALMWILFTIKPRTFRDFVRMCRLYGMTMADIRMQEAWAMAHWLSRETPPAFGIEDDENGRYDILLWGDNAVTRTDPNQEVPAGAQHIHQNVRGSSIFTFVSESGGKVRLYETAISAMPFSTYNLGQREPQALALKYVGPDREAQVALPLLPLPPRNHQLLAHNVREQAQRFRLESIPANGGIAVNVEPTATTRGTTLRVPAEQLRLVLR